MIIAGHPNKSMNIHEYQPERRVIGVVADDKAAKWMTAIGVLGERIYVGADNKLNLSTMCVNYEGGVGLKTIGQYHLGDYVNRFRHGSVATNISDQRETVLFATASGGVGIIASLTRDEYLFFTVLEDNLREVMGSVEGKSQKEWRSLFCNKPGNFVDGDFVEMFLDAELSVKTCISSRMELSVNEITERIEKLKTLH